MAREGYITEARAAAARKEPVRVAKDEWRPNAPDELLALEVVRAYVDSVLPDVLKEGEVVVHTTLDMGAQKAADRAVTRHASAISRSIQGALVAMDPRTGDIRAVVPGRRASVQRAFNRAFRAKRQPGSAFKPFVYAAAIQSGLGPATMVDDVPIEIDLSGRIWRPANYGDSYQGRVTARKALIHSSNAATIRISRAIHETRVVQAAHQAGIRSELRPVPSIALGAVEVTPLELVTAYSTFANGGSRVTPRLVQRIEAPDGKVLWSAEIQPAEPVMDPRDAYELTSMLRGVVDHGTAAAIRGYGITAPIAGKTGTTNNGADVWFVGYTPTLVAGIWFGYDEPRPIGGNASGGRYAVPAWAEFYRNGWKEPRNSAWLPPDGMIMRVIDPTTGLVATEWCPAQEREWFKPSDAPNEVCQEHFSPYYDDPIWQADGDLDPGRRDEPWTTDIRREVGRALRRILRF
jgi:penicillin-binding protein 1A